MTILDKYKEPNGQFSQASLKQLDKHNLLGFIYKQDKKALDKEGSEYCEKKYLWQKALNIEHTQAINEILDNKQSLNFLFLKGAPLLNSIYEDLGERYMSDIDIYVPMIEKTQTINLLKSLEYQSYPMKRWAASEHKDDLFKVTQSEFEVNIDIHYQLLFNIPVKVDAGQELSIPAPSLETMFFHLVTHLGYQHTYLRLNWLLDVYLFTQKYIKEINWPKLYQIFKETQLKNDLHCIYFLMAHYFDVELPISLKITKWEKVFLEKTLSPQFLLAPQKHPARYYLLKHYLNTNITTAIKYDFLWMISKLRGCD